MSKARKVDHDLLRLQSAQFLDPEVSKLPPAGCVIADPKSFRIVYCNPSALAALRLQPGLSFSPETLLDRSLSDLLPGIDLESQRSHLGRPPLSGRTALGGGFVDFHLSRIEDTRERPTGYFLTFAPVPEEALREIWRDNEVPPAEMRAEQEAERRAARAAQVQTGPQGDRASGREPELPLNRRIEEATRSLALVG